MTVQATAQETGGWQRLDRRMLYVNAAWLVPAVGSVLVTLLFTGGKLDTSGLITVVCIAGVFVVVTIFGLLEYAVTRYRVTPGQVEMVSGFLVRKRSSTPRDRIRSVDLTANPVHRVFGLTVVRIGTGQGAGSEELKLEAISRAAGEELRGLLIRHVPARQPATQTVSAEDASASEGGAAVGGSMAAPDAGEVTLARMQWSWLRFAPLTAWALLIGAAPVGLFFRGLEIIGMKPNEVGIVRMTWDWVTTAPVLAAVVSLCVVVVLGAIGAFLIYVEMWWNYRLERLPEGLRVHRGLLTTRSVSLEERRLRGVEVSEHLLIRAAGGAEAFAIATGTVRKSSSDDNDDRRDALHPPAPISDVMSVAGLVLRDPAFSRTKIKRHSDFARRRRVVRSLAVVVLVFLATLWFWPWTLLSLVLLPIGLWLALDAYRNLGHALVPDYLIGRAGTFARRTFALRRDGVIGWRIRQTPFQRRLGLATLTATTSAGKGAYKVRDIAYGEGLSLADETTPGVISQFLK